MRVSCRQHGPSPIDTEHASAKKNDILLHNHKRSSHSGNVILSQYYYPICHPLLRCPICPCNVLYGCVFTPSLSHLEPHCSWLLCSLVSLSLDQSLCLPVTCVTLALPKIMGQLLECPSAWVCLTFPCD